MLTRRDTLRVAGSTGLAVGALAAGVGSADAAADPGATAGSRHGGPPVIWVTGAMLDRASRRVAGRVEPFHTAWIKTLERADEALDRRFVAYQGPDQDRYFLDGRDQAKFARDLAIAYRITDDRRYLDKANSLLSAWARDAIEYPYPDPPMGMQAWPGSNLPHGSGLRIGRVLSIFADAYAMVWEGMSIEERGDADAWMRLMMPPLLESQRIWREGSYNQLDPPWLGHREFVNHLSAQTLGMAAVGYAVRDERIIRYVVNNPHHERNLERLIDGVILMPGDELFKNDPTYLDGMPEPLPGEIYDRYRTYANRGMLYSLLNLRFLALMAEMTRNNAGRDYYRYVGPGGENLELSYEVYSPWWITGQASSVNSPYYDAEQEDPGFDRIANDTTNNDFSMWEIAFRRYPENDRIASAVGAWDRRIFDGETWGWTALLTHGRMLEG